MKKILFVMFMLIGIVGCSCKDKTIKVKLDYEAMPQIVDGSSYLYQKGSLVSYDLKTIEEYDAKIENKDNFFLVVYRNGCFGCELMAPALSAYVEEHQVVVYTLSLELIGSKHDLYKAGITDTPYFVLIEDGKIVYKEYLDLDANDEEANVEKVEKWMKKHVEWSEN